jgi:hypothetical protein
VKAFVYIGYVAVILDTLHISTIHNGLYKRFFSILPVGKLQPKQASETQNDTFHINGFYVATVNQQKGYQQSIALKLFLKKKIKIEKLITWFKLVIN